jgi:hypothetical protein
MFGRVRQQSEMASPLDGDSQPALMLGTSAHFSARTNGAAIGQKALQHIHSLVVDSVVLIITERANLHSSAEAIALPAAKPAAVATISAVSAIAAVVATVVAPFTVTFLATAPARLSAADFGSCVKVLIYQSVPPYLSCLMQLASAWAESMGVVG